MVKRFDGVTTKRNESDENEEDARPVKLNSRKKHAMKIQIEYLQLMNQWLSG